MDTQRRQKSQAPVRVLVPFLEFNLSRKCVRLRSARLISEYCEVEAQAR